MLPNLLSNLKTSLLPLADLAVPRVCLVCGRELCAFERDICLPCLADLPLTRFEKMSRNPMADTLNAAIERIMSESPPGYYVNAAALFYYHEGYTSITKALKYDRNFAAGRHFAYLLADALASSPLYSDVDAVVPVPLHFSRRFSRGYNQAEVVSRVLASRLGAASDTSLLRRIRRTSSQANLSPDEKSANLSRAFRSRPVPQGYRHILVADDVFTTGATLSEACAALIRKCTRKDVRISVATLGFAGE